MERGSPRAASTNPQREAHGSLAPALAMAQMSYGRFRIPVFAALLMVAVCARAQEPPQPGNCNSADPTDRARCLSAESQATQQYSHMPPKQVSIPPADLARQYVPPTPFAHEPPKHVSSVQPSADLAVSNTLTPAAPFHVGEQIEFSLVVANQGPSAATGVRLYLIHRNLAILSVSTQNGSGKCNKSGCAIPELQPGMYSTVYVTAQIAAPNQFLLTATVSARQADPQPGNNREPAGNSAGTARKNPRPPPPPHPPTVDLAVQSVPEPGPPYRVGDEVTVNVFVRNGGPAPATDIRVSNVLNNLRLVKQPDAACVAGCTVPRLAANESIEFTIRAQIEQVGKFSATTSVAPSQVDSGPGPLSATSEGEAESTWWRHRPPLPIVIAVAVALGLLGAGGAIQLRRKAWWLKRIHVLVQLDANDRSASVGGLHVTGPAVGIRITVLPGQSVIGRLPIEREETHHG